MKKIPYLLMGAALLMYTISPGQSSKSSAPQKLTITDGEPVATKPVATGTAPKKITSVEGITEYALKNGLRVLLFPDQSKSTITVNITYLVGSRHEGYGETGMAHLLEHMVFKGTPKHPNIPQELTAHGCRPNGTTWYDRTNYYETFTANDENLNWALDLESDRMINSYIAKKDLETEFSVVRNEFESGENDPGGVLMERVMSTAFIWHNYGNSTIGSKEDIEKVPIENLQAFYRKYYQPDNAVLLIAGKFDEAKTLELVNKYFGAIPRPERKLQPTYTVEPTQDGERSVVLRRTGDVQVASCGYHICAGAHPDYPAVAILADVLSDEPSGRLYKALIDTKKASSAYGFSFGLKDPGFMYFQAEVNKDKSLDDANRTMLDVLDNLAKNPITDEEVTRAKNAQLKYFEMTYNNADRVGLNLSEYIAKGDWRLWFHYRDQIEKVSAADVNRVAAYYLKPSNRTTGLFIPDPTPMRTDITAAPEPSVILKDYKGKAALAQAEAFDPSIANVMSRVKTGKLDSGVQYSYLRKSTRGNAVNMVVYLQVGSEKSMMNKSETASLCADMLRRGTKNLSYQQLNDSLDKLKATVNVFMAQQNIAFNVQTTRENLKATIGLLEEIMRRPSFPASEFEKLKEEEITGIESQKSEPNAIAGNVFDRMTSPYPKGDFRYSSDFEEQVAAVKAVTIEDVKKFYADYYNSAAAVISMVGDFDENETMAALTPVFKNWTSPVKFEKAKEQFFDISGKTEKIKTPDKKNAMMMCGVNLQLQDNHPDYAALIIGNYILGGGFLNSRLAVRIRQKEGISYGIGSFLQAGTDEAVGGFGSYAIFNPGNLEKLQVAYKDELQRICTEGITETELQDAVKGYLQNRNVSRSQDRELVSRLANYLTWNRDFGWDKQLEDKMATLKVADVNAAIKKWIQPEKISFVYAGDF
jgi:zinc protease